MQATKTILVTGASTGFGNLISLALAREGHTVYASMSEVDGRNASLAETLRDVARSMPGRIRPLQLDVRRQDSADAAVTAIMQEAHRLDVVVHSAGHLVRGVAEAFSPEEIASLFDANVLGAQRVNIAALPILRKQEGGLLIWIGSSTTRGGHPPFMGPYTATKAAGDLLAQSYAYELSRFGIETTIVLAGLFPDDTGQVATEGAASASEASAAYSRYDDLARNLQPRLAALIPRGADPAMVADEVTRIVGLPDGRRPFRVVIDPSRDGTEEVTEVAERFRTAFAQRVGMTDLLHPTSRPTSAGRH